MLASARSTRRRGWLALALAALLVVGALPGAVAGQMIDQPDLTLATTATTIYYGGRVTFAVQFGSGLGGQRVVDLQASPDQLTWVTIGSPTTDSFGAAVFIYPAATNLYYRATFAGSDDLAAGSSDVVRVLVRETVALRPGAGTTRSIRAGTRITYTATVRPMPVNGTARVSFLIYRRVNGAWVFRTSATRRVGNSGYATFLWTWARGEWYVRARANPTGYNAGSLSMLARVIAR